MTRFLLVFVALGVALTATIASAQYAQPYGQYPQQSAMYGPGPMPQSQYGYGPMAGGGMYPALPGMAMNSGGYPAPGYSGAAYPAGYQGGGAYPASYANGYAQAGMQPSANQMGPPSANSPKQSSNQQSSQKQSWPGQEYHGPQPIIAKSSPPPMKLPKGVTSENGLLYYKGSATADVDYQHFPMGGAPSSPYRMASYQEGGQSGMPNGSTPSVMNGAPPGNSQMPSGGTMYGGNMAGGGMPAGGMMPGGQMMPGEGMSGGECQSGEQCNNSGDVGYCHLLYGLFHGAVFPGKLGYVWSGGYDNLAMQRNSGTNRTLLLLDNGDGTFSPAFNANDLEFNWDYGGKAHLELIGPSGITYQATYTRIATFVISEKVLGDNNLTLPGDISAFSGFNDVDEADFFYSSSIQTGELNMIWPFGSFEVLAGYRYMQVDEKAQIATIDSDVGHSQFDVSSLNRLNGGQVGLLGRWEMFGLFDFDFDAKFGVMANSARIDQSAMDPIDGLIGSAEGTKNRVAYITELGAQGVIPLSPSISFHTGYNVYFIDGVALAPNQFDFSLGSSTTAGTKVRNHGDITLQGVNCGLTFVW